MILPNWKHTQQLIPLEILDRAAAHAPEADRTRDLDPAVLDALKRSAANRALLTPAVGASRQVSWSELGRAMAALGAACPSTLWVFNNIVTNQYEAARQLWGVSPDRVRTMAERGDALAGAHATPPEARIDGDRYVLNGRSTFGSGALYADRLCGSIKVPGPPPEEPTLDVQFHVRYAMYEPGQAGLRVERTWTGVGVRASATDDIVYEDVVVPIRETAFTPERSARPRMRAAPHPSLAESFSITSGCLFSFATVGIATEILRLTVKDLSTRQVRGGSPAATLPDVQSGVGRTLEKLFTAAGTVEAALAAADARRAMHRPPSPQDLARMHFAAIAATATATESAQMSWRLLGGAGLREGPVERLWRDIQAVGVHISLQPHAWHGRYGQAVFVGEGGVVPIV